MSQIEELQSRLAAAMARIGTGIAALSEQAQAAAGPMAELQRQLDEERQANAQLEERLRTLKAKHEQEVQALRAQAGKPGQVERLRAELTAQADAMARLDMDVQRVRLANSQLRDSSAALRKANEEGVGEPHLINKAMLAELEGLRAARATDAAEISALLARLEPLLAGATQEEA